MNKTKICTKCNLEKDLSCFSKETKHKDGYSYYCRSCRKEYRIINKEKIKKRDKEYNKNNLQNKRNYYKTYRIVKNKRINEYRRNHRITVLLKNPLFICSTAIRDSIRHGLKNKGYLKKSKTINILSCSFIEFKEYLESKFEPWMNWDNYGNPKDGVIEPNKTWDIDHIIPISSATTEEDVIRLNHYTNLQPLCSYVNRFIKKDSISF